MDTKKVWFVTGASKGLGLSLVKTLLQEGYRVAATSRTLKSLETEIESSPNFLPLEVQLTDEGSVANAVKHALEAFGTIDVVVNNAGYGQIGTLEELSDEEARRNFDVNVFGALNVIRAVMPHFRAQHSGYFINVSSIGGMLGTFAGFGVYCATKFAVVGFTESLSEEVKEFGVKATVVYPGYFRTNFLDNGSLNLPKSPIEEYTAARNSEKWHETEMRGNQPGSPEKAAAAFIQLAESAEAPLHFVMGSDAFGMAKGKIKALEDQLRVNEELSKSTDL
jgi:NAD(P)-dependent dehydrogenase (short-subunit alcohol dehydrogenase family)